MQPNFTIQSPQTLVVESFLRSSNKKIACANCGQHIQWKLIDQHEWICKNQVQCSYCKDYIKINQIQIHQLACKFRNRHKQNLYNLNTNSKTQVLNKQKEELKNQRNILKHNNYLKTQPSNNPFLKIKKQEKQIPQKKIVNQQIQPKKVLPKNISQQNLNHKIPQQNQKTYEAIQRQRIYSAREIEIYKPKISFEKPQIHRGIERVTSQKNVLPTGIQKPKINEVRPLIQRGIERVTSQKKILPVRPRTITQMAQRYRQTSYNNLLFEIPPEKKQKDTLTESKIKGLPTQTFHNENEQDNQQQVSCSICYMQFEPNSKIIKLKCQHYFHDDCVGTWLKLDSRCPMCKEKVVIKKQMKETK